jgi:Raf kinase inhibitor-like YbhB/YbcL family protein
MHSRFLRAALPAALLLAAAPAHAQASRFSLSSSDYSRTTKIGERFVFNGFGCSGQNVSPALAWTGAPAGTKSFALTIYDPDAPTGSGWWHWVVYNIPANVTSLAAGAGSTTPAAMPAGVVQGNTDFGTKGYGGPCPPKGDKPHRYVVTVHALKVDRLDVPANATAALIGFNINANHLGAATLTARYGR